jgi:hypothetical protein
LMRAFCPCTGFRSVESEGPVDPEMAAVSRNHPMRPLRAAAVFGRCSTPIPGLLFYPPAKVEFMQEKEATTVSIGALAVVATYLTETAVLVPTWVTFIGWTSFYAVGAGTTGFVRSAIANLGGVVIGAITLVAMHLGADSAVVIALAVGVGSAMAVQASKVSVLGALPAIFFGFSGTVGTVAVTGKSILTTTIDSPVLVAATALLLGNVFGIASHWLAEVLGASKDVRGG